MEVFTGMFDYLQSNWPTFAVWFVAINGLATLVVNMTPTPTDNQVWGQVYKLFEWTAGIFTRKAKQTPPNRLNN